MVSISLNTIVFFIFLGASTVYAEKPPTMYGDALLGQPEFWNKPRWVSKMDQQRQVLVSVQKEELRPRGSKWTMKGAGYTRASIDFSWNYMNNFENLKKVKKHVKEVKYDEKSDLLSITISIFGRELPLVAHIQRRERPGEKQFHWKYIKGAFRGLIGVVRLVDVGRRKTEISMTSVYKSAKIPLPGFVVSVGLEAIIHYISVETRSQIEAQFKKENKVAQ